MLQFGRNRRNKSRSRLFSQIVTRLNIGRHFAVVLSLQFSCRVFSCAAQLAILSLSLWSSFTVVSLTASSSFVPLDTFKFVRLSAMFGLLVVHEGGVSGGHFGHFMSSQSVCCQVQQSLHSFQPLFLIILIIIIVVVVVTAALSVEPGDGRRRRRRVATATDCRQRWPTPVTPLSW